MTTKRNLALGLSLAVIFSLIVTTLALADPIVNNIDTTIDPALETRTIATGGSTVVGFFIVGSNTDPSPDAPGCNATGATPASVTLNVPADVTASLNPFSVVGCYDPLASTGTVVNITFSSNTPGTYSIRHLVTIT